MIVRKNPDIKFAKELAKELKENNGYCPCKIEKTKDTKCMCKEFRDLLEDDNFYGLCYCELYIKESY